MVALGHGSAVSPEAWAAVDVFAGGRGHLGERLRGCVSARELVGKGFGADVDVAAGRRNPHITQPNQRVNDRFELLHHLDAIRFKA